MNLYFVFLRRPVKNSDRRNDPFWEFGSFGKTGCHSTNLLNSQRSPLSIGDQLAFLQGGASEIRVVGLSPPITFGGSTGRMEIKWNEKYRPIPYLYAPLLINNAGASKFSGAAAMLKDTNRSTWCGAAGSRLRSRTSAIDQPLANQIINYFRLPGLPEITAYYEAVTPNSERWSRIAKELGWAEISERRKEYDRLDNQLQLGAPSLTSHNVSVRRSRTC